MQKFDIGIIGGGQLGKMLIEEGLRYNVTFATLDPEINSPASFCSHKHIVGSLQEEEKIKALVEVSTVTTYEIEHINIEAVKALAALGHKLIPAPEILELIQDKGLQKQFYYDNNIPTAPFFLTAENEDWIPYLKNNVNIFKEKFVAKLRKGGYDGKGVALLNTNTFITNNITKPFSQACVLEAFVPNEKEISIIIARDAQGATACFDPVEMEFDPIANLVTYLICPAQITNPLAEKAKAIAIDVVTKLNAVGIFAIELFVTKEGDILVNEIAPRPHNSGHQTIEGNYTSQYEQLIRILLNKPLGDAGIVQPSAMINVIGALDFNGPYFLAGEAEILKMPGVYIHMYGKKESKPNRKLGHITVIAPTINEVKEKASKILKLVSIQQKQYI